MSDNEVLRAMSGPPPRGADKTERRRAVVREVESCVCQNRNSSYGEAEDNFRRIADIANVVLEKKLATPLDELDVALFSACIKMGRLAHMPEHMDSLVDLAGYAVCGAGIAKGRTP